MEAACGRRREAPSSAHERSGEIEPRGLRSLHRSQFPSCSRLDDMIFLLAGGAGSIETRVTAGGRRTLAAGGIVHLLRRWLLDLFGLSYQRCHERPRTSF